MEQHVPGMAIQVHEYKEGYKEGYVLTSSPQKVTLENSKLCLSVLHPRARDMWLDEILLPAAAVARADVARMMLSHLQIMRLWQRRNFEKSKKGDTCFLQQYGTEQTAETSMSNDGEYWMCHTAVSLSLYCLFTHPGGAAWMTISQWPSACPRRFCFPARLAPVLRHSSDKKTKSLYT